MVSLDPSPTGAAVAGFTSILFPPDRVEEPADDAPEPDYFGDLRLDQVIAKVLEGCADAHLEPFFRTPVRDLETIAYRHEVFRDVEDPVLLNAMRRFRKQMWTMRLRLTRRANSHYRHEMSRWLLNATEAYCAAVGDLTDAIAAGSRRSTGIRTLGRYVTEYRWSPGFAALHADARHMRAALDGVRFRLTIGGTKVRVSRYEEEPDYSVEVVRTFEKFRQGAALRDGVRTDTVGWMDHVEGRILERVALLYPAVFGELDAFVAAHEHFVDPVLARFDREVQVYVAWLDYRQRLLSAGLRFCYPAVATGTDEFRARDTFDLALARRLVDTGRPVVTNDVELAADERILVISGPNQGGKTTLARTIGQLHHLAALGLPVAGSDVALTLPDRVFAHFDREESLDDLAGKLEEELRRIRQMLAAATSDSVVIMNESFSSTTTGDALRIGRRVFGRLISLGCRVVAVTFLDELSRLGPTTVSMVSEVDPADPAVRTFRLTKRPADGLAYAQAIADKHRLGADELRARLAR